MLLCFYFVFAAAVTPPEKTLASEQNQTKSECSEQAEQTEDIQQVVLVPRYQVQCDEVGLGIPGQLGGGGLEELGPVMSEEVADPPRQKQRVKSLYSHSVTHQTALSKGLSCWSRNLKLRNNQVYNCRTACDLIFVSLSPEFLRVCPQV